MQNVRSKKRPTKIESVSRLITLFRTFNQAKGLSSVTIKWYDDNLNHFAKECGSSFTPESILSFFAHLQNEHSCHAVTVNMYFRSLRAFFIFCVAQKLIKENPLMGLKQLKVHKTIHQIPSMETLKKVLTRLQGYRRTGPRDVAIFLLLLDCGLRPGEIVNICLQDINWLENRIMVDGKTGQRIVPFSPKARSVLKWAKQSPKISPACVWGGASIWSSRLLFNGSVVKTEVLRHKHQIAIEVGSMG